MHKNFQNYWCAKAIESLIAQGVEHFFIAPGSRSTPLVAAVVKHPLAQKTLCIDERSLAFCALGYSKAAKKPGVIIVTSGTAVANLYPAIVEAYMSLVPLLIITADRPYELRDCGANQTIFQANIFSNHINKSFDLGPPSPKALLPSLAVFLKAIDAALGHRKGPVHINVQLREPLDNSPDPNEAPFTSLPFKVPTNKPRLALKKADYDYSSLLDFMASKQGLIVVGELLPSALQDEILSLASLLGWPIFADIASNLRFKKHPHLIHHFEVSLLSKNFIASLNIDRVLKFGGHIVSKRFLSFIETTPECLSISDSNECIDPIGRFSHLQVDDLESMLKALQKTLSIREKSHGNNSEKIQGQIINYIDDFLAKDSNNEAFIAANLIEKISEPVNLFVSSSMPIRDLDQFAKPSCFPIEVYVNRGASGIDGIISSAVGVAKAKPKLTIVFIGDVAFLHDTNGLMLLSQSTTPLLVIVINNGGGGIFHFLSIAKEPEIITPFLDTPHGVSIESLCNAHQIYHQKITDNLMLDKEIKKFFIDKKTMVLEVIIDRNTNVSLHKNFYEGMTML